ncbi:MAG TPA: hypothetical protein VD866_13815 [Urbifossiella sp.]|nr:hypothetical protein [Urbifossiella sp.]
MTATVTLDEAAAKLKDLVRLLGPGDEIVIKENLSTVARIVGPPKPRSTEPRPAPGLFRGSILYMAPDFDAPLEDMKEYME